jgi:hypothetical protein
MDGGRRQNEVMEGTFKNNDLPLDYDIKGTLVRNMAKRKISTFSKQMTEEEAKREMELGTPVGKALKTAEEQYKSRRKK